MGDFWKEVTARGNAVKSHLILDGDPRMVTLIIESPFSDLFIFYILVSPRTTYSWG